MKQGSAARGKAKLLVAVVRVNAYTPRPSLKESRLSEQRVESGCHYQQCGGGRRVIRKTLSGD